MTWAPASFAVAWQCMPPYTRTVAGYSYRGLGMHISTHGRRAPIWTLTHLGSGHAVARIKGRVAEAFPIASEFAECGDWSFDGLQGWRNVDPELRAKAFAILEKHKKRAWRPNEGRPSSPDAARAVLMAREQ